MKKPEISIIVVTYGRYKYLKDLINSVRVSTPQDAYEFVIVSSDHPNSEKIKWLLQQNDVNLILADTRKEWQLRKGGSGYYGNLGAKKCKKEWLIVVNDDMRFDKSWYGEFVNFLADPKNSNAGNIIVSSHISKTKYGSQTPIIGKTKKGEDEWKDMYLSDYCIISKNALEQMGFFDEKITWYGTGADISLAIEFLTNKETVPASKIKIDHLIAEEGRNANTEDLFTQFHYVINKWDKWCKENNCQYIWDPGIKPYTLANRAKNYLLTRMRRLRHYIRYALNLHTINHEKK